MRPSGMMPSVLARSSPFYIYLPVIHQEWTPGLRIEPDERERYLFAWWMAHRMRRELQRAIYRQRYEPHWVPLSPAYLNYKKKKGLSLKIWEATSLLRDNIIVYRDGDYWAVGPNPKVKYPGRNVSILQVARWLEYGTPRTAKGGGIPARPLFRPLQEYLRKHSGDAWIQFQRGERP